MKVAFLTLGCKLNQYYTDCIVQKHIEEGDKIIPLIDNPDIAYINTCSVTTHAGHKSRKLFRKAKRYAKETRIMGCHAKLFPEDFKDTIRIDESGWLEHFPLPHQRRKRAYLPIQGGCNDFCTYCIVPYARGKNFSLPKDLIIRSLKKRISEGYKEVILTGIHIGSYAYEGMDLTSLLKELLQFDIRIRLTSIKPDVIDRGLLQLFQHKNLMPHIHLSQQSGDNLILKRMGRNYTREKTLWITEELQKIRENIRIAGDFIVGFPGERDEEFQNSISLIKKAYFSHLHVFRYSKRPYTLASLYPDHIEEKIKKERSNILINLAKKQRANFIKEQIGKEYYVITENKSQLGNTWSTGITPNYIKVHFQKDGKTGEFIPVRIKDFKEGYVYGEVRK